MKCTLLQGHVCLYAHEAVCFSNMVLEHINLEYSSRLLMVQYHMVLMVQDHKSRPKCHKKPRSQAF